eukprot:4032400-Amphidinium_carterae.1
MVVGWSSNCVDSVCPLCVPLATAAIRAVSHRTSRRSGLGANMHQDEPASRRGGVDSTMLESPGGRKDPAGGGISNCLPRHRQATGYSDERSAFFEGERGWLGTSGTAGAAPGVWW